MDRAVIEIASDGGWTMDLLPEISRPFHGDDRSFPRIDGNGMRMQLEVRSLAIPDVKLIRTPRFSDARGYFCETFQRADFAAEGIENDFLQDNQSSSDRPGTVRGLHFQRPPFAQTKLVRVLRGSIFDVAVDLRRSSPSYGKHIGIELSSEGNEQLLIPTGFGLGIEWPVASAEVILSEKDRRLPMLADLALVFE